MTDIYQGPLSIVPVHQNKQGQNRKEYFLENLKNEVIKATANLLNSKREEIFREFIDYPLPKMQSKEFYKKKIEELRSYDELEIGIYKDLIKYCTPDEKFNENVVNHFLSMIDPIVERRKEIFTQLNDSIENFTNDWNFLTQEEFSSEVEDIFINVLFYNAYFKAMVINYEELSKLSDDERILQTQLKDVGSQQGKQKQQSKQLEADGRKQSQQGQLISRMQQVKNIKLQEGTLENSEKLTDETLKKLKTFKKYYENRMGVLQQLIHFDLSDRFKDFFLEKLEEYYIEDNDILKAIIPDTERYQQVMKIRRECINAFKTQESYNDLCKKCKEFELWNSNELMVMIENLLPKEEK
jgi:hypothetical protein